MKKKILENIKFTMHFSLAVKILETEEIIDITWPNSTANYSKNAFEMWNMRAPAGFVFAINLQTLDVSEDVLYFGDGVDYFLKNKQSCSLWYSVDNQFSSANFTSKSSSIILIFTGDNLKSGDGFFIRFEVTRPKDDHMIYEAGKISKLCT